MEGFADFLLLSGCVGFAAAFAGGGRLLDFGAGSGLALGFATNAFFASAEVGFVVPCFDVSVALGAVGFFATGRIFFTGFFAFAAAFLTGFFTNFFAGLRTGFFVVLTIFLAGFLAVFGFAFRLFFTLDTDFFSFLTAGFAFTGFFAFFADLGAGFFAMSWNLSKVLKRKSNGVK